MLDKYPVTYRKSVACFPAWSRVNPTSQNNLHVEYLIFDAYRMNAAAYMIRERITETHGWATILISFILWDYRWIDISSKRGRSHARTFVVPRATVKHAQDWRACATTIRERLLILSVSARQNVHRNRQICYERSILQASSISSTRSLHKCPTEIHIDTTQLN